MVMSNEFPIPPGAATPEQSGALTEDETMVILRTTLLPEHRSDPNILRFIQSYLRTRNIADTAREVGLHYTSAYAIRSKPDVHLAIEKLTQKSAMKYGFDATRIVKIVEEVATFDPLEFENPDGTFKKHMKDLSGPARRNLKKLKVKNYFNEDPNGVKVWAGEIIEYEFYDKTKFVELAGREVDVFKEKKVVEHDITKNMASVLLDSSNRGESHKKQIIDVTPKPLQIGETSGEE